jgi:hypothetical protein
MPLTGAYPDDFDIVMLPLCCASLALTETVNMGKTRRNKLKWLIVFFMVDWFN